MKKKYIVFYAFYEKERHGSGWLDNFKVIRNKNTLLDVKNLNIALNQELKKRKLIKKDTNAIITNIINQETI